MKISSKTSWIALSVVALAAATAVFFSGEKQADAQSSGEWGIIDYGMVPYPEANGCIFALLVRNDTPAPVVAIGVRSRFIAIDGTDLGTYNLVLENISIAPYTTDVTGWIFSDPQVCSVIGGVEILKYKGAFGK
jgi:hypothetical protein